MGGKNGTTYIDPSAEHCTITTEYFDLVWNASYTVEGHNSSGTKNEESNPQENWKSDTSHND